MTEFPVRYFIGGGCGVVAFAVMTPILGIPASFAAFVAQALAILLGSTALGIWLFDRYVADGNRPQS